MGLGSFLNNITGASSAAKQSQRYALQSAEVNNAYQKEFAQNAHQWEVEDLKKAGLNPVLSAGGSGASASGGGVSAATESMSSINPLEAILNGVATMTSAKKTMSEANNTDADTLNKGIQQQLMKIELMIRSKTSDAEIRKAFKELELMETQKRNVEENTKKTIGGKTSEYMGTGFMENVANLFK